MDAVRGPSGILEDIRSRRSRRGESQLCFGGRQAFLCFFQDFIFSTEPWKGRACPVLLALACCDTPGQCFLLAGGIVRSAWTQDHLVVESRGSGPGDLGSHPRSTLTFCGTVSISQPLWIVAVLWVSAGFSEITRGRGWHGVWYLGTQCLQLSICCQWHGRRDRND